MQRENSLLGEENLFAKQITIENAVFGNRMLVEKLKIQEKVILEIYSDLDHKKESNLNATEIAQKLNAIFKRPKAHMVLSIHSENDNTMWVGKIDQTVLFRLGTEDAVPYSLKPQILAQKWADAINYELQLIKPSSSPLKQKIMSNIPVEQKLNNELEAITLSLKERKEKLDGLRAKTLDFSRHFARTPSMLPVDFPIASPFGMRVHPLTKTALFHKGLDFAAYYGTRVYATADGTVTVAGSYRGYGNTVKIYHGWGITTLYAHNSEVVVNPGQWVRKGQLIARSGASGFVEGAHVHYEVLKAGQAINPLPYLDLNILSASTTWTE
jgi:murein DD-endopeptidase MepM/ murein hydrolase activator NlpD